MTTPSSLPPATTNHHPDTPNTDAIANPEIISGTTDIDSTPSKFPPLTSADLFPKTTSSAPASPISSPPPSDSDEEDEEGDDLVERGLAISARRPIPAPHLHIAAGVPIGKGTHSAPTSPVHDHDSEEDSDGDFDDDEEFAERGLNFLKGHRKELTKEEEEVKKNVRKRVLKAALETLGTAVDITHEALELGVDFLQFAPVPGLAPAAKLVLSIWDAVDNVDLNRLACLRLTQRCADILLSVRAEVHDAGDVVVEELKGPLEKLEDSFNQVLSFLKKTNDIPFMKRFLKRDEILGDIKDLDTTLRDTLELFGLSVQIRILKQVQEAERKRQQDTQALLAQLLANQQGALQHPFPISPPAVEAHIVSPPKKSPSADILEWSSPLVHDTSKPVFPIPQVELDSSRSLETPEEITTTLNRLLAVQNTEDLKKDSERIKELQGMFAGKSGKGVKELL